MVKRAERRVQLATPAKPDGVMERKFSRLFRRRTAPADSGSLFSAQSRARIPAEDIVCASDYQPPLGARSVVMSLGPSEQGGSHGEAAPRAKSPAQLRRAGAGLNRSIERVATARSGALSLSELLLGVERGFVSLSELAFPHAAVLRAAELSA